MADYIERVRTNKTVDQLLVEVAEGGWKVNNLFQLNDGVWRANLRFISEDRYGTHTYFHEYADARSPAEALTAAIWNSKQRKYDAATGQSTITKSGLLAMKRNEVARQALGQALAEWR